MNGTVAIILVNYNGYKDTVECVKSILLSDYSNYKIIIVENDSLDKESPTKDRFIQESSDVILCDNNLGFAGGNNIGIKYALERYNADYIMLLNNDTVIQHNTIGVLVDLIKSSSQIGIATCQINMFYDRQLLWYGGGKFNFSTGIADMPGIGRITKDDEYTEKSVTFASGCLMVIPKEVVKKVGFLDEKFFMYSEDTDYCCRVQKLNYIIKYTNKTKIYHKVSASSGKNSDMQQYYMFRNNCYLIRKYCKHPVYGYTRRFYRTAKEIVKGESQISIIKQAWHDFRHGVIGKVDYY